MICTCLHCGRSFETAVNRAQRFCSPPPGVNMSACARAHNDRARWSRPETLASHAASQRRRRAKVSACPELSEARRAYCRRYYQDNPEKVAAWSRRYREARRRAEAPTGSVLVASSLRAKGRDVLVELLRLLPASLGAQTREEVVACAALMVVEGLSVEAAARAALAGVRKSEGPYLRTRQIEDCHWL